MKVNSTFLFKILTAIMVFLLCAVCYSSGQVRSGVKVLVIDPGHGGSDPGTVWGNDKEKDINLSVALKLGKIIEKELPDVKVVFTRKTDVFLALDKRTQIANDAKADLFLSIHVNAVDRGKKAPSGALTLVMGVDHTNRNLDIAMRENNVITYEEDYSTKYEGFDPKSAESYIMFSLMQYANIEQSMQFAHTIQRHFKTGSPMPDLGVRQQPILVLWRTAMPSALVELGFLPNDEDRKVLTSSSGQDKLARSLFEAFREYKNTIEKRTVAIGGTTAPAAQPTGNPTAEAPKGDVKYMIQVCSSPKKLNQNNSILKNYKGRYTEKNINGQYKYYVGECFRYNDAVNMQAEVRKTTSDAFMVAFRGDKQITVAEAKKITN